MRDIQKENKARWSEKRAEFLLTGFTFHTSCGGKFRGSNTNGGRYKYYVCRECGEHFKKDIFEKSIFDELLRDDFLEDLNKNLEDNSNKNNQLKRLKKQLRNLEAENDKALKFLMNETITESEFTKIKQKNLTEINNIKESIINIEREYIPTDQLSLDVIEIFRITLKELDQDEFVEAKAILKKMIKRIDFKDLKNFNIYLNI
ncbi:zinc ribbon domain-containing protein [Sebaldella sp. S0638]|uniref:zinc ribbon domain-containing protein n=1 Tax=Sebaldella sp. S0638 TaxID=2957809 RepID=UPI00209D490D|nr:zinc ribbon domain-containing protein [Sebaldella sp. S0638]